MSPKPVPPRSSPLTPDHLVALAVTWHQAQRTADIAEIDETVSAATYENLTEQAHRARTTLEQALAGYIQQEGLPLTPTDLAPGAYDPSAGQPRAAWIATLAVRWYQTWEAVVAAPLDQVAGVLDVAGDATDQLNAALQDYEDSQAGR